MSSIEVVILGTTAAVPTKSRNHPSIFLNYRSEKEFSMLMDCGEGTQKQLMISKINFMKLNDIFISHWHADHFAGLLGLIETMNLEGRKKNLKIYGPEAEKFVPTLENIGYASKNFKIIPINVESEGHEIETLIETDEFCVNAIPVKHGIPAVAYSFVEKDRIKIDLEKAKKKKLPEKGEIYRKIKEKGEVEYNGDNIKLEDISYSEKGKKMVYSGDTMFTENMIKISDNADLLLHDTTFFDDDDKESHKHTTLNDVIEISKKANVKKTILTHISRRYQDEKELNKKIPDKEKFQIANDLMRIVI